MGILINLFLTFLRVGALAFGGGFAAIPMIQSDVVATYGWISSHEFANIMAVASMTPGPIAINSATYVGFKIYGILGGLIATFGVVLVSFILIGIIAGIMTKFSNNKYVNSVLEVLRPVIVVLILVAAINTGHSAFVDYREILIFGAAIFLLFKTKIHPIALITSFGLLGIIIY
jgi:chromate transporter